MRILFCCENFYPSIGGVQEVVWQLATRSAANKKNQVEVATTFRNDRTTHLINNFKINEFKIYGNYALGIYGDKNKYINFILSSNFDIIFIYAAQQWTFDLLFEYFKDIKSKVILVPCGFSGLKTIIYKKYFNELKKKINYIDLFIFHTRPYQDFDYLKKYLTKKKYAIIPNGADENNFLNLDLKNYQKKRLKLDDALLILSNSSLSFNKGQLDILKAIEKLNINKKVNIIINADFDDAKMNLFSISKEFLKIIYNLLLKRRIFFSPKMLKLIINYKIKKIQKKNNNMTISLLNVSKNDLINLYKACDIFVFASKIEYCPLVIYEAMASHAAIISSDVGNVKSVINKYKCGIISKTKIENEYSNIDIHDFAKNITNLINNDKYRTKLANNGRNAYIKNFQWKYLYFQYQKYLHGF